MKIKKMTLALLILATSLVVSTAIIVKVNNIKIIKSEGITDLKRDVTLDNIKDVFNNNMVEIKENSDIEEYTYKEFGIEAKLSEEQEKYILSHFIIDYDSLDMQYDTTKLKDKLEELNKDREKNKYSKIKTVGNNFEVTEEKEGNYLDTKELYKYIISQLGISPIVVELDKYYQEFDKSKPSYEELSTEVEKINNTYITYTNGYKISLLDLFDYLKLSNNKITLDESMEEEYKEIIDDTIEKELDSYDTIGNAREFKTTNKGTITVSGGTYGSIFSSDNETEYIIDLFKQYKKEEDRTPIYSKEMPEEIGNTYIEVSISEQHLWYYVNGILDSETNIVTGQAGRHDTPKGVYYISERINGKYLTGDDYRTWVNKWMRLTNQGVGLHDAGWRGTFGGSTYTYNGSHGCINLPAGFAYSLFDKVRVNDCVIIY